MASTLAKIYIALSGAILVIVGVVGFFRHEKCSTLHSLPP